MSNQEEIRNELRNLFLKYAFRDVAIEWKEEKGGIDDVTEGSVTINIASSLECSNPIVRARMLFLRFLMAFHDFSVRHKDPIGQFRIMGIFLGWMELDEKRDRRKKTITRIMS